MIRNKAAFGFVVFAIACEPTSVPESDPDAPEIGVAEAAIQGGWASTRAAIVKVRPGGCSGVLIRPGAVLTAAHCFCEKSEAGIWECPNETGDNPARADVRFIDVPASDGTVAAEVTIEGRIRVYPPWRGSVDTSAHSSDDIALVLLDSTPAAAGINVGPLRMRGPEIAPQVGDFVRMVGFGYSNCDDYVGFGVRREATGSIGDIASHPAASTSFYRITAPSVSICVGDSGGPLLDYSHKVIGVASRGRRGQWAGRHSATREAYSWIQDHACETPQLNAPDWSYCNDPMCPCPSGEGDCDQNAHCAAPARCRHDVGADFNLPASMDVCVACSPYAPSTWACSAPGCKCGLGQGDCDSDDECGPGLICGHNNGAAFGRHHTWDFCIRAGPPCGNGQPDYGEACDDGNRSNGDGCSSTCQVEQGWSCPSWDLCFESLPSCFPRCGGWLGF